MRASAIRHLAITDKSPIVAAALFEKTVQIWSWKTGRQLGEFETMLDFGGTRLALTPDGSACIVGGWSQRGRGPRGLGAYSVPDGKLLWNRDEIRHIQHVTVSGDGKEIYCGVEGTSAYVLDAATGETLSRVRGATAIIGSHCTSHTLIVRKQPDPVKPRSDPESTRPNRPGYLLRGPSQIQIPAHSFALLDAAFSPNVICISEPNDVLHPRENIGGVRFYDLATGDQLCYLDLGTNRVAYNSADRRFYCVAVTSVDPNNRSLVRLAGNILQCDQVLILENCWEAAFSPSGQRLVTVHGDVYETATGAQISSLEFPQLDYPDK